jgi:putative ABC transport system permease protein
MRDLLAESLAGLLQRPARSILTMFGTTLGLAAFVAVSGLTASAGGQIDKRFTALAATEVTIEDVGRMDDSDDDSISFTADASIRVQQLNGVVHAGVWWTVPLRRPGFAATPDGSADAKDLALVAVEPSTLAAMHPRLAHGRLFDAFHQLRGESVALLGSLAAAQLGVRRLDGHPAVFVDSVPYTVLGIIDDFDRKPEMLFNVMIPTSTALTRYGPPQGDRAKMLIETELGAATVVAAQAPLALLPNAPQRFKAITTPDPQSLRAGVTGDLDTLFLMLAAICLVIGAIGIANTTLVAVIERTNEIGLRRALGARPRHVAAQFLVESTALGLLGGLIGTTIGVAVVIAVAISQHWTALLPAWAVLSGPLFGSMTGLCAGLYPALRAAAIEPVQALRR